MKEQYKGYTIKIEEDIDPSNPRTDRDNLGTMVCFHSRYDLGDKHDYKQSNFNSWAELRQALVRDQDPAVILPLRLYDHSGISMSTSTTYPYNDQWDSMQVGFIYVSKEKVRKEYSKKAISKKLKEKVTTYLVGEVETYDQYLRGDVYGYSISKKDEDLDSCWGYYGDECCLEEAKSVVDYYVNKDFELNGKQLDLFEVRYE